MQVHPTAKAKGSKARPKVVLQLRVRSEPFPKLNPRDTEKPMLHMNCGWSGGPLNEGAWNDDWPVAELKFPDYDKQKECYCNVANATDPDDLWMLYQPIRQLDPMQLENGKYLPKFLCKTMLPDTPAVGQHEQEFTADQMMCCEWHDNIEKCEKGNMHKVIIDLSGNGKKSNRAKVDKRKKQRKQRRKKRKISKPEPIRSKMRLRLSVIYEEMWEKVHDIQNQQYNLISQVMDDGFIRMAKELDAHDRVSGSSTEGDEGIVHMGNGKCEMGIS